MDCTREVALLSVNTRQLDENVHFNTWYVMSNDMPR